MTGKIGEWLNSSVLVTLSEAALRRNGILDIFPQQKSEITRTGMASGFWCGKYYVEKMGVHVS